MKKAFVFLVAIFMLTALSVSAATFKVGEVYEYKGDVKAGDIYVAGGSVDISGDINGDGIIVGGEISVLGDVAQDIMVAGGTVSLLGSVGDDLRVVGGNITVSNKIGGDLVAAGGFVKILSGTVVAKEAVIAGGAIIMNGEVVGDLTIYGEDVTINGSVGGDVALNFSKKVTIGEDASIAGNLTYSSIEDIEIPEGVFIGGEVIRVDSVINRYDFDKKDFRKFIGLAFLAKLLLMLIAGILAVIVFKRFSNEVSVQAHDNFWKHALVGLVILIVVPAVFALLLVTVLGAYVGLLIFGMYMLMLSVSKVYAGILTGALLSKWIKKEIIVDWKWAVIGITALEIALFVPLFGSIAGFIILLATFGTLMMMVYKKFWLTR